MKTKRKTASKTASKATSKTVKVKGTSKTVKVKGTPIKVMYKSNDITNRTNKKLWVVFEAGKETNGVVLSMVHSRDTVRNAGSKLFNTNITNVRAKRVKNYINTQK
jgi:hypothetical protein